MEPLNELTSRDDNTLVGDDGRPRPVGSLFSAPAFAERTDELLAGFGER